MLDKNQTSEKAEIIIPHLIEAWRDKLEDGDSIYLKHLKEALELPCNRGIKNTLNISPPKTGGIRK
jgi:hypothetical protein